MKDLPDYVLTNPNPELTRMVNNTHPGQMHFGGTGPGDRFCGHCRFYSFNEKRCAKYTAAMGKAHPKPLPHLARSCRHFEGKAGT